MTLDLLIRQTVEDAVNAAVAPLREDLAQLREMLGRRSPANDDGDELLTTMQAAELIGLGTSGHQTIRRWVAEGRLRSFGGRRALRISRRQLLSLRPVVAGQEAESVDIAQRAEQILQRTRR